MKILRKAALEKALKWRRSNREISKLRRKMIVHLLNLGMDKRSAANMTEGLEAQVAREFKGASKEFERFRQ